MIPREVIVVGEEQVIPIEFCGEYCHEITSNSLEAGIRDYRGGRVEEFEFNLKNSMTTQRLKVAIQE